MKDILVKSKVFGVNTWVVGFPKYNWVGSEGFKLEEVATKEGAYYIIDPKTICFDTNLKDSKGNNIFENDIIEITYEGESPKKWVVSYNKIMGLCRLKMYEGHGERMIFPLNERAVIIGNIKDKN